MVHVLSWLLQAYCALQHSLGALGGDGELASGGALEGGGQAAAGQGADLHSTKTRGCMLHRRRMPPLVMTPRGCPHPEGRADQTQISTGGNGPLSLEVSTGTYETL